MFKLYLALDLMRCLAKVFTSQDLFLFFYIVLVAATNGRVFMGNFM